MAIKARAEYTVSVVNDGRGEKTYIRYSDDNGRTFTKAVPLKTTGDMFAGRNIFAVNAGLVAEAGAVLDSSIHGVKCTKTKSFNRVGQLFKRFAGNLPRGQFRISGRMKTDGTTFSVNVNMGGVNAGDVTATTNWQPFSLLVNNPGYSDAPNYCFVDFRYGMTQPAATTLNLYIADLMITQGNTQYDYAPAPEDQQFGLTQGKYIGIMSWDKPYPPLDPSAYTWSAFQGQDAELYKLSPLEENAIVGNDGACKVTLRYNVTYIAGSKASKYTGDDITIKVDSRLGALDFTKKATGEWECVTTITDFTTKNLGSFNVSVMKSAQVLDTRVIPVTYATQALLEANQKLGEVVANVKGVSKLIHNMFVGSTFLEPIEGVWSMNGASVDKNVKYNNANVVFIEEHGQAADTYHSLMFVVEGCAPKKKYTVSAMIRTDNLGSFTNGKNGAGLEVVMVDNGNRVRLFDPISIVPAKANEWQKFEHTFTTPDNLTSQKLEVKFMLLRNGRLWVSQPMMNQGNVAADYTANIKDIQLSLAQIKVTANTISQTVTDLSTGMEQAGIHIDGANSEITLKSDKTKFTDKDGETAAFIKDGKVNAKAIDADKVVANGIQGKTIDTKEATFENVNVNGNINARSGKIAGFKIDGEGLTNASFNNDAYIVFRNDNQKTFAGLGGNILPPTSGLRAVARFENFDESESHYLGKNYTVVMGAQGAYDNIAIHIDGGSLEGVAMNNTIIGTNETSRTLSRFDYNVIATNQNNCDIILPKMELYDDGHVIRIKRLSRDGMVRIGLSKSYTYNTTTEGRYANPYMLGIGNHSFTELTNWDDLTGGGVSAIEFVWVRDLSIEIDGTTYYGAWLTYIL
nr:MAG TPA: hypothetical protein [Caudoviricetes sp.]